MVETVAFTPVPNVDVTLEQFDVSIGTYRPVQTLSTDAQGRATFSISLPTSLGSYKYRASWKGNDVYDSDTSPATTIKVVE